MTRTSWVELCVSDFEASLAWFEHALGFRVIAREANDYAELALGETRIQIAADQAPYWANARPRLLPPGQRGSGVEIVLLVDDIETVYRRAQQARVDIVRPLADYPWHLRQFWVRHPDGYLLRPAQRLLSVNPAAYRRQVAEAFRRETPRVAQELQAVKQTAEQLARQGNDLEAATVYETLVREIFEQSHLYSDEEAGYDDSYEEEAYYPEEEGLDELIEECIAALGSILTSQQADRVARKESIEALFGIYQHDLHADASLGFASSAAEQIVHASTPLERHTLAAQIEALLTHEEEEMTPQERQAYGRFLLDLEQDTLDDEAYLRICRQTGRTFDLIERLLQGGRIEEATREARKIQGDLFLNVADLFIQQGQEAVAERLVNARLEEREAIALLDWLQNYYHSRSNLDAELVVTARAFHVQPMLSRYQQLYELAQQRGRWDPIRVEALAFLEQTGRTPLLIQIALEEGDIDQALHLLKRTVKKDSYGALYPDRYGYYGPGSLALQVARAAEETRPREARALYRQHAERLIALRGRQNYQQACTYLARMRTLDERLGEQETWKSYITQLREQNRNLRALKEELAQAGL